MTSSEATNATLSRSASSPLAVCVRQEPAREGDRPWIAPESHYREGGITVRIHVITVR